VNKRIEELYVEHGFCDADCIEFADLLPYGSNWGDPIQPYMADYFWQHGFTEGKEHAELIPFMVLEMYGVPKERARQVGNGIQVLATRYDKEVGALKAEVAAMKDVYEGLLEEFNKVNQALNTSNYNVTRHQSDYERLLSLEADREKEKEKECLK
jgi:hypothetical protein